MTIATQLGDSGFRAALVRDLTVDRSVEAVARQLGDVANATLGFAYLTDPLAPQAHEVLAGLKAATGIPAWVGCVGMGVCGGATEVFGGSGLAVMTAVMPADSFRIVRIDAEGVPSDVRAWAKRQIQTIGLMHGDPADASVPQAMQAVVDDAGAFLVGGLASGRAGTPHIADTVHEGGVSGVLFSGTVPVVSGLSQGCSPIGPVHRITGCHGSVIDTIDDRPALEVLKQDVGDVLARDLRRAAGYIFAALPVSGSDTGDYLVRNIIAADTESGRVAIGDRVTAGQSILFTRRDHAAAVHDLDRMLGDVTRRLNGAKPRGAIYVSCVARGPNLFGTDSDEVRQVQAALGDVPLVGFFANGEFAHDRLYGYTGVLTVFT